MKKLLILLISIISALHISAQSAIQVSYEDANEELEQLAKLMDVNYLNIKIKGDLKGKKLILVENAVDDSTTISREILTSTAPMDTDSITISVMSRNITSNTMKIDIRSKNLFYHNDVYNMSDNSNHILMETKLSNSPTDNIPIFAYTTGIHEQFSMNGQILEGMDYCGLRDADISPTQWYKEFGISNYIYFTINVE